MMTETLLLAYSALLAIVVMFIGLRSAAWMLRHPKHRTGISERFGSVRPDLKAATASCRVIWIHAVSVGEVLAASQLMKDLHQELGENSAAVISTVTDTGQALAQQRFGVDHVFYAPLDFAFSVRSYLDALKPAAIVLVESGVWPRMMHECERREIPVIVANVSVNDKTFHRAKKMCGLWARCLRRASLWLAQTDTDAGRLVTMGVPSELVRVTGNLKYDIRTPAGTHFAQLIRGAAGTRPIIVAGSTVQVNGICEESMVLQAWESAVAANLNPLLILAPRHPERFEAVEALLGKYSYIKASSCVPDLEVMKPLDIFLLDTIGDLGGIYSIADVAFVGGSLVDRGGHNPLEPAQFGVPILMGHSFEHFRDIVRDLKLADSIQIVHNEKELTARVVDLLSNPKISRAMGKRASQIFERRQGATTKTVNDILSISKLGTKLS